MNLTWKKVFNTDHRFYTDIDSAMTAASLAGYHYFNWCGKIYNATGFQPCVVMLESEVR